MNENLNLTLEKIRNARNANMREINVSVDTDQVDELMYLLGEEYILLNSTNGLANRTSINVGWED